MDNERAFLTADYDAKKKFKENLAEIKTYQQIKAALNEFDPTMDYHDPIKNEMAQSIKDDFNNLLHSVNDYLTAADTHDHYVKNEGREITKEKKDKLIELSAERTATHNILIREINVISYYLRQLGIDNKLIYDIIKEDRKLTEKSETDRRAVERWARTIARYLATTSETTL